MPAFDYRCAGCDLNQPVIHSTDHKPTIHCPKCGAVMAKLVTYPLTITSTSTKGAGA